MSEAQNQALNVEKAMINRLARRAEQFITSAREGVNIDAGAFPKGDFTDQTKNLRNSIGYVIYKDGRPVKQNVQGGDGGVAAKLALGQVPTKSGYVLVVVAGMNYASYLESMGYNVITSQSMVMIKDLIGDMEKLSRKSGEQIKAEAQGVSVKL